MLVKLYGGGGGGGGVGGRQMLVSFVVCLFKEPVPISYRKMTKLSSECEYGC